MDLCSVEWATPSRRYREESKLPKGFEMAASKVKSEQCTKGFSYSSVLVALLAVGGAYVYFDRTSSLNKFSAAMTEKLCDMLPKVEDATPTTEETVATPPEIKISKSSTHYTPAEGESYDAKGELISRVGYFFT